VETTTGLVLKTLGAKNFASLGYGIAPSASAGAKAAAVSAQLAGIKVGYLNANFPLGTNVGPAVLAMKSAGVDSFEGALAQNTSFAIIAGLRAEGIQLKAPILTVGYGGDLLQAGSDTEQQAQGAYFIRTYEPIEMHTPATVELVNAMQTYAHVPPPEITDTEYISYLAVNALVTGLRAAGSNPTQQQVINAMLGVRSWNAAGLYGAHLQGFAMDQRGGGSGADNCLWVVQWLGSTFHLVPGADPVCGNVVPGKTVSAG
jgi:branched-chain amino acid transport system substrate-binding protein